MQFVLDVAGPFLAKIWVCAPLMFAGILIVQNPDSLIRLAMRLQFELDQLRDPMPLKEPAPLRPTTKTLWGIRVGGMVLLAYALLLLAGAGDTL